MKQIKTQNDLRNFIVRNNGCSAAYEYVMTFPKEYLARDIWVRCKNYEWMIWLGMRWNPKIALAWTLKTIERVERFPRDKNAVDVSVYRQLARREYAYAVDANPQSSAFCCNLTWAIYESHRAAPNYYVEENIRLNQLSLMW